jgi:hypothetical protein
MSIRLESTSLSLFSTKPLYKHFPLDKQWTSTWGKTKITWHSIQSAKSTSFTTWWPEKKTKKNNPCHWPCSLSRTSIFCNKEIFKDSTQFKVHISKSLRNRFHWFYSYHCFKNYYTSLKCKILSLKNSPRRRYLWKMLATTF